MALVRACMETDKVERQVRSTTKSRESATRHHYLVPIVTNGPGLMRRAELTEADAETICTMAAVCSCR